VPLTLTGAAHAGRHSLTLPLPRTRADLRWPGGSLTHVGQPRKHGAQAVKQSQQGQDLRLGGEAENQHALQRGRGLACLAARTAEAAQPVGTLAAGGFRDAKVRAEKRAAVLVLYGGIATRKSARECVAKAQSFAGDLEGVQSLVVESRKRG